MKIETYNIYQKAREKAGITQELMAEKMDLSVKSIRDYESGKTKPTINKVIRMCEILGEYTLHYEHLQKEGLLPLLPKYEGIGIQGAALTLISALEEVDEEIKDLIEIVKDGKVDVSEQEEFDLIISKLEGLFKPIIELKYAPH